MSSSKPNFLDLLRNGAGVPIGLVAVLAMVVVPLPAIALDVLFHF